jgi:RND family efflux transporter MFP subunit
MSPRLLLLIFLAAVLASACGTNAGPQPTATPLPTPNRPVVTVQRGELIQSLELFGRIEPVQTSRLAFSASGKIRNVYVDPNAWVTAGQLLADLDSINRLEVDLEEAREKGRLAAQVYESRLRRAQLAVEIAQLNHDIAVSQNRPADEIQLADLQLELAQLDLKEVTASITLEENSAQVARLEASVEATRLYAPTDGQLIGALVPGASVSANAAVGLVGDPSQLELVVRVEGDQFQYLSEGITVTVRLEKLPGQFLVGTIRQLPYPYGTGEAASGSNQAYITLDQSPEQSGYQIGDGGRASLVIAQRADTIWLPPQAIRSVSGRIFVYILGETGPQRVNVTTGIYNREQIEIVEGLAEGQVVILP